MDLTIAQLIITAAGTLLLPGLALYVRSEIQKSLNSFELKLSERLQEFKEEAYRRAAESSTVHNNFDKRLLVVENGHASISERIDALVREIHRNGPRSAH
jgi:hypothetical protein